MASHIEQVLAQDDVRFRWSRDRARTLYHSGEYGADFEQSVREILQAYLPATYRIDKTLLEGPRDLHKQLDVVVYPTSVPMLPKQLPIDVLTAVGEVKTTLTVDGMRDATATAQTLATAASRTAGLGPVPFFVVGGALGLSGGEHAAWLSRHLAVLASAPMPAPVWPAIFSFDERDAASALRVSDTSPIRAICQDGEPLDGVLTLSSDQLSPAAVCYLWLWAAIHAGDEAGMDYRYMRHSVAKLVDKQGGLRARFRRQGGDEDQLLNGVRLALTDRQVVVPRHDFRRPFDPGTDLDARAAVPAPDSGLIQAPWAADDCLAPRDADTPARYMLITLGQWVEEPDSWDESPWGGHPHATRRGYGYYDGMSDQELLDAARLFWAFNPESRNWDDVVSAVVAHAGIVRAVIEIDSYIGPFWGRHGFQGRLVTDQAILGDLLGREVPSRQNPITTITFE